MNKEAKKIMSWKDQTWLDEHDDGYEEFYKKGVRMNTLEQIKSEQFINEQFIKGRILDDTKDYGRTQFVDEIYTLQKENQELKKQVEQYQEEVCILDIRTDENIKLINQQKEFIKYMNDTIEDLETENVDDEEMKGYLIQRIYTFKEILQKYKEIIGDDK